MSAAEQKPTEEEQRELDELRLGMADKLGALDPQQREGVEATLAFGVALTRSEYRTLARHNWSAIVRWGRRTTALLVLMLIAWLALGVKSLENSSQGKTLAQEIVASRHKGVLISCRESNERHMQAKLGIEVLAKRSAPAPHTRLERLTQEQLIDGFVNALVPSYNCAERVAKFAKP